MFLFKLLVMSLFKKKQLMKGVTSGVKKVLSGIATKAVSSTNFLKSSFNKFLKR